MVSLSFFHEHPHPGMAGYKPTLLGTRAMRRVGL
jgi:hypothetical protein